MYTRQINVYLIRIWCLGLYTDVSIYSKHIDLASLLYNYAELLIQI